MHGTYLNKNRVNAEEYIQVNVGDVLIFGESTRIYTINGPQDFMPEEYTSQNLERFREKVSSSAFIKCKNNIHMNNCNL